MTATFDEDALKAAADLIGRSAATELEYGYLDDDVPVEQARWWAKARWGGQVVIVEDQIGPVEAAEALARKVVEGGGCTHCLRRVTLSDAPGERCRWHRDGARWVRGCEDKFPDDGPIPTKQRLAKALMQRNAPPEMVHKAVTGFYDDYESPVANNILALVTDARAAGLEDIAQQAINGDFDATKAESDAWMASPEGQATMRELGPVGEALFGEMTAEQTKQRLDGITGGRAQRRAGKKKKGGRYTPPKGR